MTTAQIIEEIKALSPEEKNKISQFLQDSTGDKMTVTFADSECVQKQGELLLKKHFELFRRLAQ